MRNRTRFILHILFILSVPVNFFAQDFKKVHKGIEYAGFTRKIKDGPVTVSALRLDLKKVRLDVVHALDKAVGRETTSTIAKTKNAIAAINAGFFRLDKSDFAGDSGGTLQIDGRLLSESINDRIALAIRNREKASEVVFGHLRTSVVLGYGTDSIIDIAGINRERREGETIVYTPEFGATTPPTERPGAEIVILRVKCGPGGPGCDGRIISVTEGKGNTAIPADGMVVSIDSGSREFAHYVSSIKYFAKNLNPLVRVPFFVVKAGEDVITDNFLQAEDIVSGRPQLIKSGKIEITWEQEKIDRSFVEIRHPRTAVAKLKDGKFLMVAVDGRQPDHSIGMTLPELAEMLLEMGATDAMNLDGGGSTTMFLDGKVMNKPSDGEGERKVSDVILVFPRKKNKR